ncbi:diguanylate cyclase [Bacteroidia bacterium]|nr:diguanylate cyclase [Bacteroidia bacterium]
MEDKKRKYHLDFSLILAICFLSLILLMVLFPRIMSFGRDPLMVDPANKLALPSGDHIFGVDEYGRDIWTRVVFGARSTVLVGMGSACLAVLFGVPLGLIAGYYGHIVDSAIMRILDAILAFPTFLLAILVMTIFKVGVLGLIITIGIVNFPRFARIVRGNVLSLKEREFVEANKSAGAPGPYIMFCTILPNCMSSILVQYTLLVATAIIIEAGMSFLGLGIAPPAPAWGSMLFSAQTYAGRNPLYAIVPGVVIFLVVMCVNILGNTLRDYFDPVKID